MILHRTIHLYDDEHLKISMYDKAPDQIVHSQAKPVDNVRMTLTWFILYLQAHMGRLRLMTNIGYGISLVSLTIAVFLMLYFK